VIVAEIKFSEIAVEVFFLTMLVHAAAAGRHGAGKCKKPSAEAIIIAEPPQTPRPRLGSSSTSDE
jgi:hypothetical protein